MKLVTYDGTELELSPVELSMLVELGLANVDIDLTDEISVDCDEKDEYDVIVEMSPSDYLSDLENDEDVADGANFTINRFANKEVTVEEFPSEYTLMVDGWRIVSLNKKNGTIETHLCASKSGIKAHPDGSVVIVDRVEK